MLRFLTAGESHGKALVVIVEGLPAGLAGDRRGDPGELARRRLGYGRGPRMRFEADEITLVAGIRHGRTLGSPVAIEIANTEWPKWQEEMSPARRVAVQGPHQAPTRATPIWPACRNTGSTMPATCSSGPRRARRRPGWRPDAWPRRCWPESGMSVLSHVVGLGPVQAEAAARPGPADLERIDDSAVRCFDPDAEARMVPAIKAAAKDGDSLGGVVEVLAYGVPVGLGSHVHWDRRLDGLLAQAFMSIQAVKYVEIGEGADGRRHGAARRPTTPSPGTQAADATSGATDSGRRHRGRDVDRRAHRRPGSA